MIVDARTIPDKEALEADICIIGAGAAGITLAREFKGSQFRIALLESGGLEYEQETQSLYQGKSIGLPYFPLETARLRFLGGSTNHWGGMCRPFDEADFTKRDWIPYSGWPFGKSELQPYYERAQAVCRLNSSEWDIAVWSELDDLAPLSFLGDRVITRLAHQVPLERRSFSTLYRSELEQADNVTVYLNANVLEIETDETAQTVTGVQVACLSGNKFSVSCRLCILAAGGIENPRVLLISNKRQPAGLGNQNDLVGRFFLEHPRFQAGKIVPADPDIDVAFYDDHEVNETRIQAYLSLSEEIRRSEELVDVQVRLSPVYNEVYYNAFKSDGVHSLRYLWQRIKHRQGPRNLGTHLSNVLFDLGDIATFTYSKIFEDSLPVDYVRLIARLDPAPNPDSRITLSSERDQLGQNRIELDWRLSQVDKRSVRRALEIVGAEVGRAELGRLQIELEEDDDTWPDDLAGGWHHMGTTRMSDNPKEGVVDKNCQVHGLSNLFIAGSSVFPTAGSGTPTLTIVALSLRLADYIKEQMI